ncbi:MAG: fumarate hydratase [bacterium]|nr:fumarate hydratase [bacterium]
MRTINTEQITNEVSRLWQDANFYLDKDIINVIKKKLQKEKDPRVKDALSIILNNAELARKERRPICQDTGIPIVFLEIGQDVMIKGGDLTDAVNRGIRQGTGKGSLRPSVVNCPFDRKNTNDNTPAVIHTEIVKGDKLKISVMAKGAGSENCSQTKMLLPTDGEREIEKFVLESIKLASSNPCPPIIVGLGIGGTLEKAVYLSKKALLAPLNKINPDKKIRALEENIIKKINKLKIGPNGFGGGTTVLALRIEKFPCHIASLPVAINISCHVHRHKEVIL